MKRKEKSVKKGKVKKGKEIKKEKKQKIEEEVSEPMLGTSRRDKSAEADEPVEVVEQDEIDENGDLSA
jgi:hypothetical protein